MSDVQIIQTKKGEILPPDWHRSTVQDWIKPHQKKEDQKAVSAKSGKP